MAHSRGILGFPTGITLATKEAAEAGTSNNAMMSAKRTAEAIAALAPGGLAKYCELTASSDLALAALTATAIPFDTQTLDVGGFYDGGDPTRATVPVDGLYLMVCNVKFSSGTGGNRRDIGFQLNGGDYMGYQRFNAIGSTADYQTISAVKFLTAGDYIELIVSASEVVSVKSEAGDSPVLSLTKL